jgi:hypothetical protein
LPAPHPARCFRAGICVECINRYGRGYSVREVLDAVRRRWAFTVSWRAPARRYRVSVAAANRIRELLN